MKTIDLKKRSLEIGGRLCLRDISLTIDSGEQWVFLGANGSGKSLLARLIYEETSRPCGFISFEKEKGILDEERDNDETDFLNYPDPGRSAGEFILESGGDKSLLKKMAERFRFTELLDRGLKYLSSGEMRKVLIAEALMENPEVIIFDEPYDGLDIESREDLEKLFNQLCKEGLQVILLLNRFSEIGAFVNRAGYMEGGKLILCGEKEVVLNSPEIKRLHYFHGELPGKLPAPLYRREDLYSGEILVKMNKVNVAYGDKKVLKNLNWILKKGEHWKISGPNGVGKSTMLSLISGDHPQAYSNDLELFGMQRGSGESVWDIKKHIGFVSSSFQTSYRVKTSVLLTVISGFYDSIGVYNKYSAAEQKKAMEWLKLIKLDDKARSPLHSLSFGEQRLVLIVRAMVKHPVLLIADEPCQGLDEINRSMVLKLLDIIGCMNSSTILYVTHHKEDRIDSVKRELELDFHHKSI